MSRRRLVLFAACVAAPLACALPSPAEEPRPGDPPAPVVSAGDALARAGWGQGPPPLRVALTADALEAEGERQLLRGSVRAVVSEVDGGASLVVRAGRATREGQVVTLEDGVEAETSGDGPGAPLRGWLRGHAAGAERLALRAERVVLDLEARTVRLDAPRARGVTRARGRSAAVEVACARLTVRQVQTAEGRRWRLEAEGVALGLGP